MATTVVIHTQKKSFSRLFLKQSSSSSNSSFDSSQDISEKEDVIKAYYKAYESGDFQKFSQFFASDYILRHPMYGQIVPNPTNNQMNLAQYFKVYESVRPNLKYSVKNIFVNPSNPNMIAVHWIRSFTIKGDGQEVDDGISIITFSQNNKIQSLTAIYDTVKTREAVKRNQGA